MKKLMYMILIFNLSSCISNKQTNDVLKKSNLTEIKKVDSLSKDEYELVNDLLDTQLSSERYLGRGKKLEIILIEEAGKHSWSIKGYEFCLNNKRSFGIGISKWPIDSVQLKNLKNEFEKEEPYFWKMKDIKTYKVTISTDEEFRNIIKKAEYINKPEKIILYISRPYILNDNYGFIFFNSGSSIMGFNTIERFYVLMKKEKGKWIKDGFYEDGVYH